MSKENINGYVALRDQVKCSQFAKCENLRICKTKKQNEQKN